VREQLRTVAGCSTLVELLHNSRKSLSVQQVGGQGQTAAWRPARGGGCPAAVPCSAAWRRRAAAAACVRASLAPACLLNSPPARLP
jgi:hypothetical protein